MTLARWQLEGWILQHIGHGREGGRKGKTSQEAGAMENGCAIDLGTAESLHTQYSN